jgi:hypothetical protein
MVHETLSQKYPKQKSAGGVAQVVEYLPSKREALYQYLQTLVPPKNLKQERKKLFREKIKLPKSFSRGKETKFMLKTQTA